MNAQDAAALTADDWPIAASLLPFPSHSVPGQPWDTSLDVDWAGMLQTVADAGFSDVDLTDTVAAFGDLGVAQRASLSEGLASSGLAARSVSLVRRSVIEEGAGEENLAYTHRCIDLAAELGSAVVSVGLHQPLTAEQRRRLWFWTTSGHRDAEIGSPSWELAVTRFRELGAHAAEVGVLLSLELYEHTFVGTGAGAVRMVEEIGNPAVGLNPDIGNLVRLHEPIEDWRELVRTTMPYANFWHVKNYLRDEDPERDLVVTMPSYLESGVINYREAVRVALESGFQGVICAEHYGGDGLSMSAANRDYLRQRVLPRRDYTPGESRVLQQVGRRA